MWRRSICLTVCCVLLSRATVPAAELEWLQFHPSGDALYDRFVMRLLTEYEDYARQYEQMTNFELEHFKLLALTEDAQRAELARLTEEMSESAWEELEQQLRQRDIAMRMDPAHVPSSVIRGWEAEFGSDPRYWQLLAWNEGSRMWNDAGDFTGFTDFKPEGFIPLVEAVERGVADGKTLLLLLPLFNFAADGYVQAALESQEFYESLNAEERAAAAAEGREVPEPSSPDSLHTEAEFTTWHVEAKTLVARLGIPTALELHHAAVAATPEVAQVYYARASHYASTGQFEQALADLRQGNAAPRNVDKLGFPMSKLREQIAAGETVPNSQLLSFLTVGRGVEFGVRTSSSVGRGHDREFSLLGPGFFQHWFAARMRQALREHGAEIDMPSISLHSISGVLRETKQYLGPWLDRGSQRTLDSWLDQVKSLDNALQEEWFASLDDPPLYWDIGPHALTAEDLIRSLTPLQEHWYLDAVRLQVEYAARVEPFLQQLVEFDIQTLTIEAD